MSANLEFNGIRIAGIAAVVPSHVQKIEPEKATDPDYIRVFQKQTGIQQRHISLIEQTGTDLAYGAAIKALEKAGWGKDSVDAVVFLSQMPDFNIGTGNAFIMHHRLKLPQNVLAYDITLGCSSFPFGLATCASLLQQKSINRILMLSCDPQCHFYMNKEDLLADQSFIHGEAATAILLEKQMRSSEWAINLYTDGSGYHKIFNPFVGVRNAWRQSKSVTLPDGVEIRSGGRHNIMDGLEVTLFSTTTVVESIKKFMQERNRTVDDYDGLVLHQANMQIMKTIARRLKFPMEKVPVTVDRFANTSGASLSLTLVDAYAGIQKDKLRLLTSAFGIGLSWGVGEIELDPSVIAPVFSFDGRFDDALAQ